MVKGKIARKQAPTKTGVRLILNAHENYPNGPYVSEFSIVGPPVGRATRPPAGPTAGNPATGRAYSGQPGHRPGLQRATRPSV